MTHRLLAHLPAALVLATAAVSSAADPGPPLSCAGVPGEGGCPPYAQVIYSTGANNSSLFEYDDKVLDVSITGINGSVRGVSDLAGGELKTYARGFDDGDPGTNNGVSVNAVAVDVFTLHGAGAPSADPISFVVMLTADGVGAIDTEYYTVGAYLHLGFDGPVGYGGGVPDDIEVLQAGGQVPVFQQFTLGMMAFANLSVLPGQAFQLSASLRTDVSEVSFLDFTHTARLSFLLPPGVTVTSMAGYDSSAAVPEPASSLLLVAGLAGLAWRRRTRQR